MPVYFWIAQAAQLLAAILALAALLVVLWLGPRRWTNLSFGFFLISITIWMLGAFTVRLLVYLPELGAIPTSILKWAVVGFVTMSLPLFWFIDSFYPINRRLFWGLSIVGALELIIIYALLFDGQIVSDPRSSPNGQFTYTISPTGYGLSLVHFFFEFVALSILVRHAAWRTRRAVLIGTVLITLSSLIAVVRIWSFPLQPYGMALGTLFLAYEVIKQQLFNPLIIHNQRLEQAVAQRTAELRTTLAAHERVQGELRVARMIQTSLLPHDLPNHPTLDLWGQSLPAEEVGGDFFSYHLTETGHVRLAVGDISGKGIPSALLMALTLQSFETLAASVDDPGQLLTDLNRVLTPRMLRSQMNAAALCVMIGNDQRQVHVANAGLIWPLRWRAGTVSYIESTGLPLGSRASERYETVCVSLLPGDRLLLISDGVIEAMNVQYEMFGFERLEHVFTAVGSQPAPAIVRALLESIAGFTGTAPRHDDMTVVVIATRSSVV